MGGNLIAEFPASLPRLHKTLTVLELGQNGIESLPDEVGQLKALQSLDLRQNRLSSLPDSIGITMLRKRATLF
jgi:Leucine-rich repeat (LRR) protein